MNHDTMCSDWFILPSMPTVSKQTEAFTFFAFLSERWEMHYALWWFF
ncbi:hypothetical protein MH117_08745 [Paenibacillus sp. ACRRX]|nr:hypothetical protein [Paenibacillus sp. ACRRX]MCG7407509.1 hypothetical protein [Paenibacillus sp. ACRRX]